MRVNFKVGNLPSEPTPGEVHKTGRFPSGREVKDVTMSGVGKVLGRIFSRELSAKKSFF